MFHVKQYKGAFKLQTFTVKGKAINLFITAENKEVAERIFSAPLLEVMTLLKGVRFERKQETEV